MVLKKSRLLGLIVVLGLIDDQLVPRDLIGGGEHYEGIGRNERRRLLRVETQRGSLVLPREQMCATVLHGNYQRPTPKGRVS